MTERVPLFRHLVLETNDPDAAEQLLAQYAVPYRSEAMSRRTAFHTEVFIAHGSQMQLSYVRTSGQRQVRTLMPEDCYVVTLCMKGKIEVHAVGVQVSLTPEMSLVCSPLHENEVQTPDRFEALFLRFSRDGLVGEMQKMLDRPVSAPLVFQPGLDMTTEAGQRFRKLALCLCRQVNGEDAENAAQKLITPILEEGLATLLLSAQRHNYTRLLGRYCEAGPWQVRIAEEYMLANAHLPLSLGDICAAAGVCSRTLQHSFQKMRGYTPLNFLRRLRLDRVRAALLRGDVTTVTDIAAQWGFLHFGRFAWVYQSSFGEKPSETLRQARKRRLR